MTFRIGYVSEFRQYEITIVAESKEMARRKFASEIGEDAHISYIYRENADE